MMDEVAESIVDMFAGEKRHAENGTWKGWLAWWSRLTHRFRT